MLAYKGNPTIKQYSFTINDLNDSSIINKLSDVSKMSLNQIKYIKYDFDGDSENEYLYISNSGFTASKYLDDIVELGLLSKIKMGTTNYYMNDRLAELFLNQANLYK